MVLSAMPSGVIKERVKERGHPSLFSQCICPASARLHARNLRSRRTIAASSVAMLRKNPRTTIQPNIRTCPIVVKIRCKICHHRLIYCCFNFCLLPFFFIHSSVVVQKHVEPVENPGSANAAQTSNRNGLPNVRHDGSTCQG
jgi:hypothetical protein